jgi:hypothetical protein
VYKIKGKKMTTPNSFENLTHSGIIKANAKDDKTVSFQIDVYGGSISLVVFTAAGGRPWKQNISTKAISNILILLRKMRANPAPCREAIFINDWDAETKRMKQVGQLGIGIDDTLTLQIDIAHNNLQAPGGRFTFPIRPETRFDFSNTSLSEKEALQGVIDSLITTLSLEALLAARLSSFKRVNTGQAGGNKGGYNNAGGGQRSYGNNSGGGGYNNRQNNHNNASGGTFGGGGVDVSEDLHV